MSQCKLRLCILYMLQDLLIISNGYYYYYIKDLNLKYIQISYFYVFMDRKWISVEWINNGFLIGVLHMVMSPYWIKTYIYFLLYLLGFPDYRFKCVWVILTSRLGKLNSHFINFKYHNLRLIKIMSLSLNTYDYKFLMKSSKTGPFLIQLFH